MEFINVNAEIRKANYQRMLQLEEVKDFIRTANREELNEIRLIFNRANDFIQEEEKSQFKVGDKVTIVHKSRDPEEVL